MDKDLIIDKIKIRKVNADLFMPFTISSGSHKKLENVFIEIKLKNGIHGYGEGASAGHITGETQDGIFKNLKKTVSWLKGKKISDFGILARAQDELSKSCASLAALETAVLDAQTKSLKIPLWKFYGKKADTLKSDITVVVESEKNGMSFLRGMAKKGFKIFKIKIGADFDADIKRVLLIRRDFPKSEIYLDANCGYGVKESLNFIKELKKRSVYPSVFEQPVHKDDFEGLKFLSKKLPMPVCADESASTFEDAFKIIRSGCSAINIKLMKFGLLRSREIWNFARAKGLKLMMGEFIESPLSSVCAAHFAGGLGGFDFVDLDAPFFIKTGLVKTVPGLIGKDGSYNLEKAKSGLGVEPVM